MHTYDDELFSFLAATIYNLSFAFIQWHKNLSKTQISSIKPYSVWLNGNHFPIDWPVGTLFLAKKSNNTCLKLLRILPSIHFYEIKESNTNLYFVEKRSDINFKLNFVRKEFGLTITLFTIFKSSTISFETL